MSTDFEFYQPMAQITTAIADTVKQSEDKIKDLQDTRLTGDKLKAKLTITKTVIESINLDKPRTVCSNPECCSLTSSNNSLGTSVPLFKQRCEFARRLLTKSSSLTLARSRSMLSEERPAK